MKHHSFFKNCITLYTPIECLYHKQTAICSVYKTWLRTAIYSVCNGYNNQHCLDWIKPSEQLQNTPQLIYMSLKKNSVYCVMPRSSKPPDTCKWGGNELRGILKFSQTILYASAVGSIPKNRTDTAIYSVFGKCNHQSAEPSGEDLNFPRSGTKIKSKRIN